MIPLLLAGLILIALITSLMLALPALARPTLPFGVRVGVQRVSDPTVIAARRLYARLTVVAAALAAVVSILVLPGAGSAAAIGVIASAVTAVDLLSYYGAHRRIRTAKLAGGWTTERRQGVAVDTTFRTDPVRVPWSWGLPALAIVLLTAGIGWVRHSSLPATLPPLFDYGAGSTRREPTTVLSAFQPVIYQIAITVIVVAALLVVLRARPDLDAARPKGSARRYRVYLRGIAVMSLLSAACLNLSLLFAALRLWEIVTPAIVWQVAVYVPLIVLLGGWLIWEIKVGQAGHRLPALPGEELEDSGLGQRDDDRHWFLAGTVYINRRDPALLVHDRLGSSSWTLNLGHPIAWLLLGVLAVALIVLLGPALAGR
ncbi:putative membrane protein [Thermocatellispora tengchongensis]|uniref:Putative membrane protein n=1 Tax=Thermocatellispora tengchongensis TaxID=1073253 RepID=A0A840P2B6_9ACTN|nr:hypothetical protein [Thermocatellispora tengchongensis]MBB5133828.1 putative membrane protein [Thermocatellispora tengchongensis]